MVLRRCSYRQDGWYWEDDSGRLERSCEVFGPARGVGKIKGRFERPCEMKSRLRWSSKYHGQDGVAMSCCDVQNVLLQVPWVRAQAAGMRSDV